MSAAGLQNVTKTVESLTLHLDAVRKDGGFMEIIKKELAREGKNSHAAEGISISKSTLHRYYKLCELQERSADIKTPARATAYENIRNPLSLCAVMHTVYKKVDPHDIVSSDDFSVLLNGWLEKPKVITTKRALELLAQINLSVSVTEEQKKQRVVTFNCSISIGGVVVKVMKVSDRNFISLKGKPRVFEMENHYYIMLHVYGEDATLVQEIMYWLCIIPSAIKLRADNIAKATASLASKELIFSQSTASSSSQTAPNVYSSDLPVAAEQPITDKQHEYLALLCDGAYAQVEALMGHLNKRILKKNLKILLVKYAGGCSMEQSANDQGRLHNFVHAKFKSASFRYEEVADPSGLHWADLKCILQEMLETPSFNTIWKCIKSASTFLDEAFTKSNVVSAFRAAGTVVPNPDTGALELRPDIILSHCPAFRDLTQEESDFVLSTIEPLSAACEEHGIIPEEEFQSCLDHPEPVDNCPVKTHGMPLNQMTTNRQRAMVLSNSEYFECFTMLRKHKEELAHAKELAAEANNNSSSSSSSVGVGVSAGGGGVAGGGRVVNAASMLTASTINNNGIMEDTAEAAQNVKEPPAKVRKVAKVFCSNPLCLREISDFSNIDEIVCGQKKKWQRGGCKMHFCCRVECHAMLLQHRNMCLSSVK